MQMMWYGIQKMQRLYWGICDKSDRREDIRSGGGNEWRQTLRTYKYSTALLMKIYKGQEHRRDPGVSEAAVVVDEFNGVPLGIPHLMELLLQRRRRHSALLRKQRDRSRQRRQQHRRNHRCKNTKQYRLLVYKLHKSELNQLSPFCPLLFFLVFLLVLFSLFFKRGG